MENRGSYLFLSTADPVDYDVIRAIDYGLATKSYTGEVTTADGDYAAYIIEGMALDGGDWSGIAINPSAVEVVTGALQTALKHPGGIGPWKTNFSRRGIAPISPVAFEHGRLALDEIKKWDTTREAAETARAVEIYDTYEAAIQAAFDGNHAIDWVLVREDDGAIVGSGTDEEMYDEAEHPALEALHGGALQVFGRPIQLGPDGQIL